MITYTPSIRTVLFALLPALAIPALVLAEQRPETAAVERRVAAFALAFRDADVPALESMLAPRYVHTNGGASPLSSDQWLGYVSTRREELASGQLRITRYENQDLAIVLHGATAVVTGVNVSEGVRKGTPFSRNLRFTQVWVEVGGTWLRAAFHDAEASP